MANPPNLLNQLQIFHKTTLLDPLPIEWNPYKYKSFFDQPLNYEFFVNPPYQRIHSNENPYTLDTFINYTIAQHKLHRKKGYLLIPTTTVGTIHEINKYTIINFINPFSFQTPEDTEVGTAPFQSTLIAFGFEPIIANVKHSNGHIKELGSLLIPKTKYTYEPYTFPQTTPHAETNPQLLNRLRENFKEREQFTIEQDLSPITEQNPRLFTNFKEETHEQVDPFKSPYHVQRHPCLNGKNLPKRKIKRVIKPISYLHFLLKKTQESTHVEKQKEK